MPYDGSGTYTLPSPEYPFIPNTLADANDVNTILADLQTALSSALLRTGVAAMSAPLKLADGTALLPGLAFNADTNTGLWRPGADILGFTTGGTERLRITTVALNASLPIYAQDGTTAAPAFAFASDTNTGFFRIGADRLGLTVGGTTRLDVANTGAIGLTGNLTVSGTSNVAGAATFQGDASVQGILSVDGATAAQFGLTEGDQVVTIGKWRWVLSSGNITLRQNSALAGDFSTFDTWMTVAHTSGAVTFPGAVTGGSFSGVGTALTALNASNLASGTVPDARFPATLPALSGVNLTALNASNLGSGTVPDARISGAYTGITTLTLTTALRSAAGSVGIPSISFSGDINTGLYSAGADLLGFATNGGQRMTIDATGRTIIQEGGASGATANSNVDGLTVESNNATGISVLVPTNQTAQIALGDATTNSALGLVFDRDANTTAIRGAVHAVAVRHPDTAADYDIGFRKVPRSAGGATTLVVGNAGKSYASTGTVTVPASVFSDGDTVLVYNNTAAAMTLTQGAGLTLRLAGTATTGSRTIEPRGFATIWFNSATEAIVSGNVS